MAAALWELSAACGHDLVINRERIPVPELAERICAGLEVDQLASIAPGALLLSTFQDQAEQIWRAMEDEDISCHEMGKIKIGKGEVWLESGGKRNVLPYSEPDGIDRLFEIG